MNTKKICLSGIGGLVIISVIGSFLAVGNLSAQDAPLITNVQPGAGIPSVINVPQDANNTPIVNTPPANTGVQLNNDAKPNTNVQEKSEIITVATVNIVGPTKFTQDGNNFKISFGISNRESAQPEIKYGITLIQQVDKSQYVVDQKVYDEVLNLKAGETADREVEYSAPKYLKGKYTIVLEARNTEGLVFSMIPTREIELNGDGQYIDILSDSCYLIIDGDKNNIKYQLRQGVDISSEENLTLHCEVMNNFQDAITAIPSFETHYRSIFGKLVSRTNQESVSLPAGQKTGLTLAIPKANDSQSYETILAFKDGSGNLISNSAIAHYVLRGASATIQNIFLDKEKYSAGDTAKLKFFWTGAADSFNGSRGGKTDIGAIKINIDIVSNGQSCMDPFSEQISEVGNGMKEYSFNIKNDCENPQVSIRLTDSSGKVLAEKTFNINSAQGSKPDKDKYAGLINVLKVLIALVIISAIIIVGYGFIRKKKSRINVLIWAVLLSGGIFFAQGAKADVFYQYTAANGGSYLYYNVDMLGGDSYGNYLSKRTFMGGEWVRLTGTIYDPACSNTALYGGLWVGGYYLIGGPYGQAIVGGHTYYNEMWAQVPWTPGTYKVDFWAEIMAQWLDWNHDGVINYTPAPGYEYWGTEWITGSGAPLAGNWYSIWYTVAPPPSMSFWSDVGNGGTVEYGAGTNIHLRSSNADYCWGSGSWGPGHVGTSGDWWTGNLTSSVTYYVYCGYWPARSITPTVSQTVYVEPRPSATLTNNSGTINYNTSASISLRSSYADTCHVWDSAGTMNTYLPVNYDFATASLTGSNTYYADCYNSVGSYADRASVAVNVNSPSHVYSTACVSKEKRICDAWCNTTGAWCDAVSWTSGCAGSWYNVLSTRTAVDCCVDTDCTDSPGGVCDTTTNKCKYDGVCGTANGRTYAYDVTSYGSDTQCATAGTPSDTRFPLQGSAETVYWTCPKVTADGNDSPTCSASRQCDPIPPGQDCEIVPTGNTCSDATCGDPITVDRSVCYKLCNGVKTPTNKTDCTGSCPADTVQNCPICGKAGWSETTPN